MYLPFVDPTPYRLGDFIASRPPPATKPGPQRAIMPPSKVGSIVLPFHRHAAP